jgi:hypothetical protein
MIYEFWSAPSVGLFCGSGYMMVDKFRATARRLDDAVVFPFLVGKVVCFVGLLAERSALIQLLQYTRHFYEHTWNESNLHPPPDYYSD